MAGIACEMVYTWNGKELSTLTEEEKALARGWLKEHREDIKSIKQIEAVARLLEPMTYDRAAFDLFCIYSHRLDCQIVAKEYLEKYFTLKGCD